MKFTDVVASAALLAALFGAFTRIDAAGGISWVGTVLLSGFGGAVIGVAIGVLAIDTHMAIDAGKNICKGVEARKK